MKVLLFALLLVAFMDKDPVTSLQCYTCGEFFCNVKLPCSKEETFCYTVHNTYGKPTVQKVKGCARKCPKPVKGKPVECCRTDFCN
ncbi:three-fingered toxin-13 [Crotalus adamanteus]|uniref:Three-fingered toxin-13 n=1 Tax=Crotalus adamanteus TaxID=8729 RepID=A0AAW1BM52_CROAD